jgi:alginate O-acetyltransferase complex protein AlgI
LSFASLTFLYFFLPAVLAGYYVLPHRWRNGFLLLANLVFYAWGEPSFLIVILATTVINFYAAKRMQKNPDYKKTWAILAILFDLALLIIFKYAGFLLDTLRPIAFWTDLPHIEISLPLGISFYTFQVLSYIIDVYRGDVHSQDSLVRFSTYMTLFPQLIAGPIVRYRDLADQLGVRQQNLDRFAGGIRLLLVGLAKKVLIANQMGALWETLKAFPEEIGILGAWVGAAAFTLQIYFDFSGYSDMARGLGKLFAFELPINFDYPYISKNITEFWRRWHISLGTWFRDYIYFTLGGSRCGTAKTVRNLLVVWALTGLWHGASWNFVLWGLYYFVLLVLEKLWVGAWLRKAPGCIAHCYTMLCVTFGWVLFAFDKFDALGQYVACMFTGDELLGARAFTLVLSYLPLMLIAVIAALPIGKRIFDRFRAGKAAAVVECLSGGVVILLCTAALVAQSYNPFLYFRF